MIGLAVGSGGTSIPAQILMIGSAVAMAGAEVFDMVEASKQGMLDRKSIFIHGLLIASCALSGATVALKVAGMAATSTARIVAGLQFGVDTVCVAVFTAEALKGLKASAHDPEGVTFKRLLGFFLQMGMNGLMLFGVRESMLEAAGMKAQEGFAGVEENVVEGVGREVIPPNRDKIAVEKYLNDLAKKKEQNWSNNPKNVKNEVVGGVVQNIPRQGNHVEVFANKPMKVEDAMREWEQFLGPGPYSCKHPRTGLPDMDRIVSADGKRSIRYGNHEMGGKPSKHHFHEETWTFDPSKNVMNVDNLVVRVPLK